MARIPFARNLGITLLGIYLILSGLFALTGFGIGYLLPVLALIAGILLLAGR